MAKASPLERQRAPLRPPKPRPDRIEPMRLDATYAGLLNDQLNLEGAAHPVTIDKASRDRIAGLRRGDRVTLLFAPGRVAQVVDFQHASVPQETGRKLFEGVHKGDRIQLRLSGNAWVAGEVVMLAPRVVIDFSHEPSAFVGCCSYDRTAIEEARRLPALDMPERLHNRLANASGHPVADGRDQRSTSARGKSVAMASRARPRARVGAR
ncbi:MAG: hypothetical protein U1E76_21780 [Planctomycetota bacterium]